MENSTTGSSSGGISFIGLLTIVFIVLKLTGVIKWSWLWVIAPAWIPLVIYLIIALIVFLLANSRRK